ncbi:MAG TPA: hydroxyacid dehydrogenase [Rhodospirillaceae bacterium]|nr:hydroxyacid dehydrogenase [Rhodospirillaceae bacterium]HCS68914.1 hydroxyacid dehydrogenase [Rhodospirillaceae bacterium]|tara:strand:+ start:2791 stop:3807 length:1017 start_codon:yes stop_codon:yes gene_type:complete
MVKVVRTDRELQCPVIDAGLKDMGVDLVLVPDGAGENVLLDAVADADLILMCYTPITARVIAAAPRLKGIVKYGVGIDAIDVQAARARGIPVVNIPEYAERTVAEGAFTLMLALAKKLIPLDRAMRADGWAWPEAKWLANDIAGKTVGIVGAGRIGRAFAQMAGAGFGARVIAYSPHTPPAELMRIGIEPVADLMELMARADVVSVHSVLNDETRGLIGARELAAMKPTAIILNVARGAVIDEAALVRALLEGRIAGAGLDVYSQEPLMREGHPLSPLFAMDNVILLPHLTFFTHEAMERLERETLERCREVLDGRPVTVKSPDPRLRAQTTGVRFAG